MASHWNNWASEGPGPGLMVKAELGAHCVQYKPSLSPREIIFLKLVEAQCTKLPFEISKLGEIKAR